MDQKQYTFTFSVEETNLVLTALGQMPFSQVYEFINKIQQTAQSQMNPPDQPKE
jgi:hypothetical protein